MEGQAVRYARDGSVMERLGGLYTLQRVDGDWKFVAVVAYPPSS